MAASPKKPQGFYSKSDMTQNIKKSGKRISQEVPFSPGNVAKAVSILKNVSKTKVNPVDVVKNLSTKERQAVSAALQKINPAPKGKFPSKAEMPKDGTQIIMNKAKTKVIKISPSGKVSSRPTKLNGK